MDVGSGLRASLRTLALLGLAFVFAPGGTIPPAWGETATEDIAFDSELTFLEWNHFGSYRRYSIVLTIKNGAATLSIDKDGRKLNLDVPVDDSQALWQRLLDSGVETLTESPLETVPDQSHFMIQYRIIDRSGGFLTHSADEQVDPRYRRIITEILAMGNAHLARAAAAEERR